MLGNQLKWAQNRSSWIISSSTSGEAVKQAKNKKMFYIGYIANKKNPSLDLLSTNHQNPPTRVARVLVEFGVKFNLLMQAPKTIWKIPNPKSKSKIQNEKSKRPCLDLRRGILYDGNPKSKNPSGPDISWIATQSIHQSGKQAMNEREWTHLPFDSAFYAGGSATAATGAWATPCQAANLSQQACLTRQSPWACENFMKLSCFCFNFMQRMTQCNLSYPHAGAGGKASPTTRLSEWRKKCKNQTTNFVAIREIMTRTIRWI